MRGSVFPESSGIRHAKPGGIFPDAWRRLYDGVPDGTWGGWSLRAPRKLSRWSLVAVAAGGVTAGLGSSLKLAATARLPAGLRFEVSVAPGLAREPLSGRLLVVLNPRPRPEPRRTLGEPSPDAPPVLGRDVVGLSPDRPAALDASAAIYPIEDLARLPAARYRVQAVLMRNPDSRRPDAPGNLYSEVQAVELDPARPKRILLELTRRIPDEALPADTDRLRYLKISSARLSRFHGRPMFLRAGVILPRDFDRQPDRHYPLRVHIGGYGARYTAVERMMSPLSPFRAAWDADGAPRMVLVHLDGDGPLGDPYQVNSANHGPYGDAIMYELIPEIERRFRCGGSGRRRVLDGGSTGGWVALALQIFYPDEFAGAWSFCPDPVDFRSFQRVNIYEDPNAYVSPDGTERPSARDPRDGSTRFTMRHECRMENVLGAGNRYTRSGGQWGAWNATFGPRDEHGEPVPLWDPRTGAIDRDVAGRWKPYDLRWHLESNWAKLAPKLRGKLRIWVGEADDYFLNEAVHRLDAFVSRADPPWEGSIVYGPGQGHCWMGLSERELLKQMAAACGE
jgi:hypothetical protein